MTVENLKTALQNNFEQKKLKYDTQRWIFLGDYYNSPSPSTNQSYSVEMWNMQSSFDAYLKSKWY
jgi:hypothetical protein